jgi:hypothetical protein
MRITLIVAIAAGLATGATATPPKIHHRAHDSGSSAVRALNEKSLEQAPAATAMTPQPMAPAMSEPNAAAPSGMAPSAPPPSDPAPMPPAPPQ